VVRGLVIAGGKVGPGTRCLFVETGVNYHCNPNSPPVAPLYGPNSKNHLSGVTYVIPGESQGRR
jgi:hypothetical protein